MMKIREKYSTLVAMKNKHLSPQQRYQIDALLQRKTKQKDIAAIVGTSESTISREIKRNSHKRGYSARLAQEYSNERKERFHVRRKFTVYMEKQVKTLIEEDQWSPEQIVGYFKRLNKDIVSTERIYQFIREDKAKGGSLYLHCRHHLKHRKRPVGGKRVIIPDKVSIEQRAYVINNKERFGDWEIDTIIGAGNRGAIMTIVERKTGFHFAHPYSSWERGLNENTNELIRQYIPKGQDFTDISDEQIKEIQRKINKRPRKKLNFETPLKIFYQKIAFDS